MSNSNETDRAPLVKAQRKGNNTTHRLNKRNLLSLMGYDEYENLASRKRFHLNDNPIVRLFYGNFISTLATRKIGFVGVSKSTFVARQQLLHLVNSIIGDSNKKVLIKESALHSSQRVPIVDISLHQNSKILPSFQVKGLEMDRLNSPGWASRRLRVIPSGTGITVVNKLGELLMHFSIHLHQNKKKTLLDYTRRSIFASIEYRQYAKENMVPYVRNIGKLVREKAKFLQITSKLPGNDTIPPTDIFTVTKFKNGGINKKTKTRKRKIKLVPALLRDSFVVHDYEEVTADIPPQLLQALKSTPSEAPTEISTDIPPRSYRVAYHKKRKILLVYNTDRVLVLTMFQNQ